MSLLSRITNVFRSRATDRDIDEELQSHFDEAEAHGRDPAEARRAFGSRLRARETAHDALVSTRLESLIADARFGLRQIRKSKAASAAAIVSLGLAMGSCTAAFRLIDALLLRPLPVTDPESLYALSVESTDGSDDTLQYIFDYPGFQQLREAVGEQASLIGIKDPMRINLHDGVDNVTQRVYLQFVSGWMFPEFGLQPAAGRLFTEADDRNSGARPLVVLSYNYWERRYGKDPGAVGEVIRFGNTSYEIIGVAPEGFTGTEPGIFTDLFAPSTMFNADALDNPSWIWLKIWVRIRPGVSFAAVREQLRAAMLAHRREQVLSWPASEPARHREAYLAARLRLDHAGSGVSDMQRRYGRSLAMLGLLVAAVLLIACANVANLMMARAAARAREIALRVSIGAGRSRLVQLVVIESAWIGLSASTVGAVFAWWAAPYVVGLIDPVDAPVALAMPADWRVGAFATALTLVVTALFALTPAIRASSVHPASALKGGAEPQSRSWIMHTLVAAQAAFCVVVLLAAGAFVTTFDRLSNRPLGFSPSGVITLETVTATGQSPRLWYQVADHLRALPEVEDAAVAHSPLLSGIFYWRQPVSVGGQTWEGNRAPAFLGVSPHWLDTMRIPLLEGRGFLPDDAYPRVAIVNQAFARQYSGSASPVGRSFEMVESGERVRVRIVGIAGDARYHDVRQEIPPTAYVPFPALEAGAPRAESWGFFIVRTRLQNPTALAPLLREEVARARSEFRVANIRSEEELIRSQTTRERLLAALSVFFGAVALVLVGVGLFGVLHYVVTQTERELGIRIALGAQAGKIAGRVAGHIFAMTALGAIIGVALGIAADRFIRSLLFEARTTDPLLIATAGLAILVVAALAALPVLMRAIRIDPATLLRTE